MAALGAVVVIAAGIALAAWFVTGTTAANAVADVMPAGPVPDAAPDGPLSSPDVVITWSEANLTDGAPVAGYDVRRYDADTDTLDTIGGDCTGTVAALTCTDTAVPDGEWTYTVTPRQGGWSGAESAKSAPHLVDTTGPDVPAPSVDAAVTFGADPVYVPDDDVTLSTAATDAGSGVNAVSYYVCAGAAGSCTSANGTFIGTSTDAGDDYEVTWSAPLPADGDYRVAAAATDNFGNVTDASDATRVFVDSTPPSVSAPIVDGLQ